MRKISIARQSIEHNRTLFVIRALPGESGPRQTLNFHRAKSFRQAKPA